MERCILTYRTLPDNDVAITPEGPIARDIWGNTDLKFNAYGQAIIPNHIEALAKVIFRRDDIDTGADDE